MTVLMYEVIMVLVPNVKNINGNTYFWLTYVKIINVKSIYSNLVDLIKHCNNIAEFNYDLSYIFVS